MRNILIILTIYLFGCGKIFGSENLRKPPYVFVNVSVQDYRNSALEIKHVNGTRSKYHLSILRVNDPSEYRGRILRISIPVDSMPKSFWKTVGKSFEAIILESSLINSTSNIDWRLIRRVGSSLDPCPPENLQKGVITE